jgi:sulfur carrier protein
MNVTINGEPRAVAEGTTVADVVERLTPGPRGVAVAVNHEIVTRSTWDEHELAAGDTVEILGASQGG